MLTVYDNADFASELSFIHNFTKFCKGLNVLLNADAAAAALDRHHVTFSAVQKGPCAAAGLTFVCSS